MYIVQWLRLKNGKFSIRREEFIVFAHALKFFIDKEINPYVERAELIVDKGYGADARDTKEFQTIEEVLAWVQEGDEDADAVHSADSASK